MLGQGPMGKNTKDNLVYSEKLFCRRKIIFSYIKFGIFNRGCVFDIW